MFMQLNGSFKCILLWETGNVCISQKKGGHKSIIAAGIIHVILSIV